MSNAPDQNTYSATNGFAVTTSDTTVFATAMRALYIGGGGDVKVRMVGGTTLTFTAAPQGSVLPIEVDMVFATGTTATSILALR